ncbi:MAG TPA: serine--tRNA ligase [Candidatus Thermoplasmatota archaeon]|nr:serine--tRNA ligase [Candidatus Thermoplasmatota archaeon]
MLDARLIREQPDAVRANLARRNDPTVLARFDEYVALDRAAREAQRRADELRKERNTLSRTIGEAKKKGGDAPADVLQRAKSLDADLDTLGKEAEAATEKAQAILMRLPNLLHETVPYGTSDKENVQVYQWGEPRKFPFPVKSHGELAEELGLGEFKRAAKVAGAGFAYLRGDLARLDFALQMFAIDHLTARNFTLIEVPFMMRREPYSGVTDLGDFETVMYKIENEDLYLIATSEHPIGGMYMDEIVTEDSLPLRYAGISACFRKEIGAHGVDTRGLFRMHQFNKIEQFVFCAPEESEKIHEEILENAKSLFRALGIPHRVVNVCTGDIGTVAAKKYDIEGWSPRQEKWVELVSCSNCTDYQARRLRLRMGKAGSPQKRVPHTLNSTAVATSRALVVILENYQQEDGSVVIPEVLRPYMGGKTKLEPLPQVKAA